MRSDAKESTEGAEAEGGGTEEEGDEASSKRELLEIEALLRFLGSKRLSLGACPEVISFDKMRRKRRGERRKRGR